MLNRLIMLISLVATVVILVMLNLTTPAAVGPLGVLVFFMMIYAAVFGLAVWILWLLNRLLGKRGMRRKDYYYAATVAFGPIMMLLVQSFGGLSFFTVLLTVAFVFLGCFLVKNMVK